MSSTQERVCVGCGETEETAHLETCSLCNRHFCPDCAQRALGRRFCSAECARAFYYQGDSDDDENALDDE